MGACETKQQSVYNQINVWKKHAYKLLLSNHLFKAENELIIKGASIVPNNNGKDYKRSHIITDFYDNNSSCFLFKLVDDSIITLYSLTDSFGKLIKFSYGFCSCPYIQDILIEELDSECDGEQGDLEAFDSDAHSITEKEILFTNELRSHFEKCCNGDKKLVSSMMDLARNPVYIRCDFDSSNASDIHPEYHLTVNFITESRFKIDSDFTFLDFIKFILDIVYGKKQESSRQFIRLCN